MKKMKFLLLLTSLFVLHCKDKNAEALSDKKSDTTDPVKIIPIAHGTLVLETSSEVIYIDPTGGPKAFRGQKRPTYVLITDIHGDHLNMETLEGLDLNNVTVIAPKAVTDKLPSTISNTIVTLNNGDSYDTESLIVEAIPMYNLREEALKFHEKGRGNGYVITLEGQRIYISGDTEDIKEMRMLKAIDKALVCMNLPYTMTVESAADAVLEFTPKEVIPYHYKGTNGLSDIKKFKYIVNTENSKIKVTLLDWYKG